MGVFGVFEGALTVCSVELHMYERTVPVSHRIVWCPVGFWDSLEGSRTRAVIVSHKIIIIFIYSIYYCIYIH